jgi:hypothetical protein
MGPLRSGERCFPAVLIYGPIVDDGRISCRFSVASAKPCSIRSDKGVMASSVRRWAAADSCTVRRKSSKSCEKSTPRFPGSVEYLDFTLSQ